MERADGGLSRAWDVAEDIAEERHGDGDDVNAIEAVGLLEHQYRDSSVN